ncbi:uncharacterized protein Z520_05911 [Fonsecaea multimorphosa CBS 102226]|uniref:FAD/NAD(P)-binding domain-containing protein n=1 Tax=Fonsecaea multimorphosa CBS 102226 TaxID=1442371 RepID=A0A0D2H9Q4_9EURO|nr:uncharacterized protein Z520_05911 [Fonsecaea multimorphosa CBS 102226]KIX98610.1 hypothetical protein Z520_05911 [Fonsecaea multimorphosa CBS 102226]
MAISQGSTLGSVSETPTAATEVNGNHVTPKEFEYPKHVLGEPRALRIIIIGAGIAGIAAVKLFKERFQGLPVSLTIYEKNADVGGTWLENRYPGCACDVPAHGYTFSWEGNPNWSRAYVTAPEICEYYQGRAKAYGVYDFLRVNHRVVGAVWDRKQGVWQLEVEDLAQSRTFTDQAEVVINATGFLNKWKWPDIRGLDTFKGHKVHSARWDDSFDFTGKKVAVIGNGSSAIQIVPILRAVASHLISFNRSPTWITPEFGQEFAPEGREQVFTEQQKSAWASDPKGFLEYRKRVETTMNQVFDLFYKESQLQKDAMQHFRASMKQRLGDKGYLADKLVPNFAVGCRRVTPGHNYLESLAADNVTVETGQILHITPDGLEMEDGTRYTDIDAIVCATGFDTSFRPAFTVVGEQDELREVWKDEPKSYLSIAAPGFPNFFFATGPNCPLANGTFVPCLERTMSYIFELVAKVQRQGIKSVSPKQEAVDDFQEYKDSLMKDLTWTSGCRSWYKNGQVDGKVWGPWPGSALHFLEAMAEPRWEDWDIKYTTGNRFSYFGNGKTSREEQVRDLGYYVTQPGA